MKVKKVSILQRVILASALPLSSFLTVLLLVYFNGTLTSITDDKTYHFDYSLGNRKKRADRRGEKKDEDIIIVSAQAEVKDEDAEKPVVLVLDEDTKNAAGQQQPIKKDDSSDGDYTDCASDESPTFRPANITVITQGDKDSPSVALHTEASGNISDDPLELFGPIGPIPSSQKLKMRALPAPTLSPPPLDLQGEVQSPISRPVSIKGNQRKRLKKSNNTIFASMGGDGEWSDLEM